MKVSAASAVTKTPSSLGTCPAASVETLALQCSVSPELIAPCPAEDALSPPLGGSMFGS